MHKSNKFLSLFTKKTVNTNSSPRELPIKTTTPSSELYHTIEKLPLNRFIDVAVDGNLSALIISGFPTQLELMIAWDEIQSEYTDIVGDHEHKHYMTLMRDVHSISLTLEQISMLVEILEQVYYKKFADRLNELLFTNFVFDPYDNDAYTKTLKACVMRSKGFKIDMQFKQAQLQAIEEKNSSGNKKYTRAYFQSVLITLSDHAKFPIQDNITVFEFAKRLERYNSYCEEMERLHNSHKK
jgi:hypothetical protein